MANDAGKIVVGANGTVYVSDTTAAAPTDATTTLGAVVAGEAGAGDYVELGYVAETGVTVTPGQTVTPIRAWQSAYPVRRIITERMLTLDFVLREFNAESIPFAFGGGSLTEDGDTGKFTYTPPSAQETDFRTLVIDWQDDDRNYRLYIPNGQVTQLAKFSLSRTAPAELPIQFELNHFGAGDPWTLFSDDAGLEGS